MKRNSILATFLLVFTFLSCNQSRVKTDPSATANDNAIPSLPPAAEPVDKTKYLITDNQAGPFKAGNVLPGPTTLMKYQMRIEQTTRATDGGIVNEQVTVIAENGNDLLVLKPGVVADHAAPNTIMEVSVLSPKYRTAQNIGVGSTIGEFKAAYPSHRIWYTYVSDMFVLETDLLKAQFIIDEDDYLGHEIELTSDQIEMNIDSFNTDGKIRKVRLVNYSHNL